MAELETAMRTPAPSITEAITRASQQVTPTHGDDRWIQTYTGRRFWPLNPRPEDIDIVDIAHALSLKCRFTGHCKTLYSVAEHSVRVSECIDNRPDELWGLLHDASEAYLPDVARPIKPYLPGFREIERRVMEAVCERFGLPPVEPASVSNADVVLLATERRDLMADGPAQWRSLAGVVPLLNRIHPWPPGEARRAFLERFGDLTAKRY